MAEDKVGPFEKHLNLSGSDLFKMHISVLELNVCFCVAFVNDI